MNKPHYIREWRKFRGLTQADLAAMAGVSQSNINQLESGKTQYTQPSLERIATALYLVPADLLTVDPNEPSTNLSNGSPIMEEFRRHLETLDESEQKVGAQFGESHGQTQANRGKKRKQTRVGRRALNLDGNLTSTKKYAEIENIFA